MPDFVETCWNLVRRGLRCLFGDQTLFCRAAGFEAVSGFNERLPIMEDADLCLRMHMAGPSGLTAPLKNHRWGTCSIVCSTSDQCHERSEDVSCTLRTKMVQWPLRMCFAADSTGKHEHHVSDAPGWMLNWASIWSA